jgi:hypothetical protein
MAKGKTPIQEAIPDVVREPIKDHLREGVLKAEEGYFSAPTCEDSLTGGLGCSLQVCWSEPINVEDYVWKWRVKYRKLGSGNQHSSEEKSTGADGIFQIEVKRYRFDPTAVNGGVGNLADDESEFEFHKGVLFQAKRDGPTDKSRLLDQLHRMNEFTPQNGIYIEYGRAGYRMAPAEDFLTEIHGVTEGGLPSFSSLGDFLASQFMECQRGVVGMHIDLHSCPQKLTVPSSIEPFDKLGGRLSHALIVEVSRFPRI